MIKRTLALAACFLGLAGFQSPPPPRAPIQLWRLDCGSVMVNDLDIFSDTFLYVGQKKRLTDSCYLIRHGENYLLWDTGLPGALAGKTVQADGMELTLARRLVDQLAQIGVRPEQVTLVGISHRHDDHTGQLTDFPKATLLIGAGDFAAMKERKSPLIAPWTGGGAKVERLTGDKEVFGDGSVVILAMPGHTENHHSLLVRLPKTGPVLLSGDLYHFYENRRVGGVPSFNTDRADTLASIARFEAIARQLKARVIIQHEPGDIAKLPPFPRAAE
jgi:glyoxylase-like metal-dependent hydrolase (beta-lactamase superfamily II)